MKPSVVFSSLIFGVVLFGVLRISFDTQEYERVRSSGVERFVELWLSKYSDVGFSDDNIDEIEVRLREAGFELVEAQVLDKEKHLILAEKPSGREKLTSFLSVPVKRKFAEYENFTYYGSEGKFPVIRAKYCDKVSNIQLILFLRCSAPH